VHVRVQGKSGIDNYAARLDSLMALFERMLEAKQMSSSKLVRVTILGIFAVNNALWVPDGQVVSLGKIWGSCVFGWVVCGWSEDIRAQKSPMRSA
jgi:hypothetical protein